MGIRIKRAIKLILINYIIFITLLVTVEISGQLVYKIVNGKFLFENSRTVFKEHPYLSASPEINAQILDDNEKKTISTNKLGYRITRNNVYENGKVNIICLGGSTTFCTGVTDEDSWPYILQQKLGNDYNVYNLGVPGYTTLEAIIQLSTIVPELDPDVVIIYEGWNDIRNYHAKPQVPDYYWHGMSQKINLNVEQKEFKNSFFLTHIADKLRNIFNGPVESFAYPSGESDPYIDSIYVRNLKLIQSICDHLQVKAIFIPQVMNLDAYTMTAEKSDHWTPRILNTAMPTLIKKFNALTERSILRNNYTLVVDSVLMKYEWEPAHFIDKAHFSRAGGEYFVEDIVLEAMKSMGSKH